MKTLWNRRFIQPSQQRVGFTLIELLVSMAILSVILIISTGVISQMQKAWRQSSKQLEQFREARMAFETITRSLRQAKLNPYLTYQYNNGPTPTVPASQTEVPQKYIRNSELQFVTGQADQLLAKSASQEITTHGLFFQASLGVSQRDGYEGLNRLLCARGYFIMYGDDSAYRPAHVTEVRSRFRLMEYRPPSESNQIYTVDPGKWFENALSETISTSEIAGKPSFTRPVAENILALIISPRVSVEEAIASSKKSTWIAPDYAYDSSKLANATMNSPQGTQHMLSPAVLVTLVAIDEGSAIRLNEKYAGKAPKLVPNGAFTKVDDFEKDLDDVVKMLQSEKLGYRVFTSVIPLRNSKWEL